MIAYVVYIVVLLFAFANISVNHIIIFHLCTGCTGIYIQLLCGGGGVYKCMCSGVSESSVFQNAVTAVHAHVPVLATL
jgi:hypothetical protein